MIAAVSLGGCSSPGDSVVLSAAQAAFEDRLAEEQVVDTKIKANILKNNIEMDKMLALDLSVDVWKTRVMITGELSDAALRDKVISTARKDSRISKLYNDIEIVTPEVQAERRTWREKAEDGADSAAETAEDFWIETKISAQLLAAKGVSSVNYRWRCVQNTVSILGEAQTPAELNTVLSTIKSIKGVKAINNYIKIKGS